MLFVVPKNARREKQYIARLNVTVENVLSIVSDYSCPRHDHSCSYFFSYYVCMIVSVSMQSLNGHTTLQWRNMSVTVSQGNSGSTVCSTVCFGWHQRNQSPRSWHFASEIHRSSVDYPHKGPETQEAFPCHDFTMEPTCSSSMANFLEGHPWCDTDGRRCWRIKRCLRCTANGMRNEADQCIALETEKMKYHWDS